MSQNQCQTFIKNKCALYTNQNGAMKKKEEKEHCFICIRSNACDYCSIRRAYRVNKPSSLIVVVVIVISR